MYEYCEYYIYDLTSLRISDTENQERHGFYSSVCTLHVAKSMPYTCVAAFMWTYDKIVGLASLLLSSWHGITIGQRRICFVSLLMLSRDWPQFDVTPKDCVLSQSFHLRFLIRLMPAELTPVVLILTCEILLLKILRPLHIGMWRFEALAVVQLGRVFCYWGDKIFAIFSKYHRQYHVTVVGTSAVRAILVSSLKVGSHITCDRCWKYPTFGKPF
jgi:hypothetical protein